MKKGFILAFILLTLIANLFAVYAQESDLNNGQNVLSNKTETAKSNIFSSFGHWIANFSDKLWENIKEAASKVFDAITTSSHSSSSSGSSSSSSGGAAYNQLQGVSSGGWS